MRGSWLLVFVLSLSVASSAMAAGKKSRHAKKAQVEEPAEPAPEPEPEPAPEPPPEEPTANEGWNSDSSEPTADEATPPAEEEAAPATDARKKTWWVGPYLHGVWVPSFMLGLFLENPPTVANASFGVNISHRSEDGFTWVLGLGYTGYGFHGPFQKTGDPVEDTEWVDSSLGLVHVSGALLWSTELSKIFSIEYGIGLDFGVVTGDLVRTEAFQRPGGGFAACAGPGNPPNLAASGVPYCEQPTRNGFPIAGSNTYDEFGAHYGVKEKRVPPVAATPSLPLLALRITPFDTVPLAFKLEGSYGIFQFRFGISAQYGLDI